MAERGANVGGSKCIRGRIFREVRPFLSALLLLAGLLLLGASVSNASPRIPPPLHDRDPSSVLLQIHKEVSELGKKPGEDLIKWDFHIGPADDDTNQDEHLVILIHESDNKTKMTIQVTKLVPARHNPNIRYGRNVKTIVCSIEDGCAGIERSDYRDRELAGRLPLIMEAVRNKKKLLDIK